MAAVMTASEDRPHCLRCGVTNRDAALRALKSGAHVCRNQIACDRRRSERIEAREATGSGNG